MHAKEDLSPGHKTEKGLNANAGGSVEAAFHFSLKDEDTYNLGDDPIEPPEGWNKESLDK